MLGTTVRSVEYTSDTNRAVSIVEAWRSTLRIGNGLSRVCSRKRSVLPNCRMDELHCDYDTECHLLPSRHVGYYIMEWSSQRCRTYSRKHLWGNILRNQGCSTEGTLHNVPSGHYGKGDGTPYWEYTWKCICLRSSCKRGRIIVRGGVPNPTSTFICG